MSEGTNRRSQAAHTCARSVRTSQSRSQRNETRSLDKSRQKRVRRRIETNAQTQSRLSTDGGMHYSGYVNHLLKLNLDLLWIGKDVLYNG